ncbi:SPASM domain-containing protein [Chloroflexales bacterium ZM16-3]|nr:SPASM domain-containing protein [Chloroflexales bacterium ZM16-3]
MPPATPHILIGETAAISTDCACPTPPPTASPVRAAGLYQRADGLHRDQIAPGWALLCNTLAGGAPALLSPAAEERLAGFVGPRPLDHPDDLRLAEARLLAQMGAPIGPVAVTVDTLTAWVHVTNACNLECPYCYVRKSSAQMNLSSGQRAIDALIATALRRGFRRLKLKYAGGEAALSYRLIGQIHAYAADQAAQVGVELEAVVLSNGTVMPAAFADWLAASGVRLMISVDGVGADHDRQRPWKGGGAGAFAALERSLVERLLPRGIRPTVSITINGMNAQTAHAAVRWAIGHDLPFSLNFYRESDASAHYRELRYEEQQIIVGMRAAYAVIAELLPTRPFLDGLLDRVQAEAHGHACGVGHSYVVITHSGQVAQCQMELDRAAPFGPESDLIGLVAVGSIHNLPVDEREGCRECQWRYRCAGGCPALTLRTTGRSDIRSPNCAIYQALLPEALRLEGLRMLRHRLAM